MKKVMVFGVFDGVHDGHRAFLRQAKACGDYLVAVVAQDHIVEHLKGHYPEINLMERFEHLKDEDGVDEVVAGDSILGSWEVVRAHAPDVIALGYDQEDLKYDLEANLTRLGVDVEIKVMEAYEPNTMHSSIVRANEDGTRHA